VQRYDAAVKYWRAREVYSSVRPFVLCGPRGVEGAAGRPPHADVGARTCGLSQLQAATGKRRRSNYAIDVDLLSLMMRSTEARARVRKAEVG
jgi:hypothetical protein